MTDLLAQIVMVTCVHIVLNGGNDRTNGEHCQLLSLPPALMSFIYVKYVVIIHSRMLK